MDNALVADTFSVKEEHAIAKPTFIVQKKIVANIFKTALFLLGISAMIINQARKEKVAQTRGPETSGTVIINNEQAVLLPFNFIK